MRKGKVFNSLRRPRLLRKQIPGGELVASALVLVAIAVGTLWVSAQRDSYDPSERDIAVEVLERDAVPDTLYRTPLKRWRDPALGADAGVGAAAPADLGPLPPTLLQEGWRAIGRPQTFSPETLYEKIDGQAEQFLKFGFRGLRVVSLGHRASQLTLDVYLYDQGTFSQSLGLYAEQRGKRPVVSAGEVHHTPNSLGTIGMVGRYVVHVIGSAQSEIVAQKAKEIVAALAPLAKDQAPPPPAFSALRGGLRIPFASIEFTPINVFQLGFAQRFWFGKPDPKTDLRFFVHDAGGAAAATQLAARLEKGQAEEYERVAAKDGVRLFRHRFLKTYFALATEGPWVYGLEGADDRGPVADLLSRLRAALPHASPPGDPPR